MDDNALSLRERKQRRTREAITEAAMSLFTEKGFDGVTVADIAERAEVGRSTFFRYFADKQEVLFADDGELHDLMVAAADEAAAGLAPLGDSLAGALAVCGAGLLALTRRIVRDARDVRWLAVRARLVEDHPELRARNLVKERGYVAAGTGVLLRHGATPATATLAAALAAACYATAHAETLATGRDLPAAVDAAFQRLAGLDGPGLRALLA